MEPKNPDASYHEGDYIVFRERRPTRTGTVLSFRESDYTPGLMVYHVGTTDGIAEVEPQDVLGEVRKCP